jgi:hypothetical protein
LDVTRLVSRSAQSEYACSWDEKVLENRGIPKPIFARIIREYAEGGAGIITLGNIPIHREHAENEGKVSFYV